MTEVKKKKLTRAQRVPQTIKESVVLTFELLGGVQAYASWAAKNPDKFYDHYIKLLPSEVKAELSVSHDFTNVLERARARVGSNRPMDAITDGVRQSVFGGSEIIDAEYEEAKNEPDDRSGN